MKRNYKQERFTELHGEEKREDGDRGDQGGEEGDSKRERAIYPVIKSLCALHSLEHPEVHRVT